MLILIFCLRSGQEQPRLKEVTTSSHLVNGDVGQTVAGGSSGSTGPPVVSITGGQPFLEGASSDSNSSKQTLGYVSKNCQTALNYSMFGSD